MAVKPRINESLQEKINERIDTQVRRAYLLWLGGLFVGALKLKPEKVEYGGISFSVDSSDKLQGIIYFVCLLLFVGIIGVVLIHQLQNVNSDRALKRRIIYEALGKRRTIIGMTQLQRSVLRSSAKALYVLALLFLAVITLFPALHIIFFQQSILLTGVDVIFQTVSLKNGRIDPLAPATLTLTFLLMGAWTIFMYRLLQRLLGPPVEMLYINMMSAATFAYLDCTFRTHDSYTDASARAIGLQIIILIICYLPKIIASPFMAWLSVRLTYYKLRNWRAQRRKMKSQQQAGPSK